MAAGLDSLLSTPDVGKLVKERASTQAPYIKKVEEGERKQEELSQRIHNTNPPPVPQLEKLPQAPAAQFRNPVEAFGSLGTVLAMLASLKTRTPLTSMLNAGAAAMNAYHHGDLEQLKLHHEQWRDSLDLSLDQNQTELLQYRNALESSKFDVNKAQAEMQAIAAQNKDQLMLAALSSKNWDHVMTLLGQRQKAQLELERLADQERYRNASLGLTSERVGIEKKKLEAAEKSNQPIDPSTADMAGMRYLFSQKMPPLGFGSQQARVQILQSAAQLGEKMGLSATDMAVLPYSVSAQGKALDFMARWTAGIRKSLQAVDNNMQIVLDYAQRLPLSNWKLLNKAVLAGERQFGDPNAAAYENAILTVMTEYARAMSGPTSNAMTTEGATQRAHEILDQANSPAQLSEVFKVMRREMSGQIKAATDTEDTIKQTLRSLGENKTSSVPSMPQSLERSFASPEAAEQALEKGEIHSGETVLIQGRRARIE